MYNRCSHNTAAQNNNLMVNSVTNMVNTIEELSKKSNQEAITVLKIAFSNDDDDDDEAITVYFKDYKSHLAHLAKCAIQNFEESFRHFWKDLVKEVEYNSSDLTEEQKAALDRGSVIKFLDDLNKDGSVKRREVEEVKPEKVCFIQMVTSKRSNDYKVFKLHTEDMMDACWDCWPLDPDLSEIDEDGEICDVNLQYLYDILKDYSQQDILKDYRQHDIWSHLCHGGTIYIDNEHHRVKLVKVISLS